MEREGARAPAGGGLGRGSAGPPGAALREPRAPPPLGGLEHGPLRPSGGGGWSEDDAEDVTAGRCFLTGAFWTGVLGTSPAPALGAGPCALGARLPRCPSRPGLGALRGLRGFQPGRQRSRGLRAAKGDSGVGIRRKGSTRREGWTPEAAERQKRL
nr:collagen alpha-1(I) chain-like [Gorilla gorilla gorilla]